MHTRWFLLVLALIGAALACNLPGSGDSDSRSSSFVTSVAVNPPSGSGSFTLEVIYDAGWTQYATPEMITCYYVTPDGATMLIGDIVPDKDSKTVTQTGTLTFSVSQPGDYTASCESRSSGSKASGNFTVSDYPKWIEATGWVTLKVASPATECVAQSKVSLSIGLNGAAQLLFTAPHREIGTCSSETDTWYTNGQADFTQQTVTFTSGSPKETASGVVSYKGDVLNGMVEYVGGVFKYKLVLGETP